jgi:hypothetical protein
MRQARADQREDLEVMECQDRYTPRSGARPALGRPSGRTV